MNLLDPVERPLELGLRLRLKKPHPCGGRVWEVDRLGADIGLLCMGCGRRVVLPYGELRRRVVAILTARTAPAD